MLQWGSFASQTILLMISADVEINLEADNNPCAECGRAVAEHILSSCSKISAYQNLQLLI